MLPVREGHDYTTSYGLPGVFRLASDATDGDLSNEPDIILEVRTLTQLDGLR